MTQSFDSAYKFEDKKDLEEQLQEVQEQFSRFQANNQIIWQLLVQISNRLQRSSTSIKTAVSSLLDFDIFWDEATEYEFLQVIDSSSDELNDLIVLMTLAFRSQAKTLEIEAEPNVIQEILATLQNAINKNKQAINIAAHYPSNGKLALVDYQYLSVALGLLIEVIIGEDKSVTELSILVTESSDGWRLQMKDINEAIVAVFYSFFEESNNIALIANQILPENALKLMTACRILHLQNIKSYQQDPTKNSTSLCLTIPAVKDKTQIE